MKKILLIGASSFIGTQLVLQLRKQNRVIGTFANHRPCIRHSPFLNLTINKETNIEAFLEWTDPDAVIYCAAETDLKRCESHYDEVVNLHSAIPIRIAKRLSIQKVPFIYLSSSKVFSGDEGSYKEADDAKPKCVYGGTKLQAEVYLGDFPYVTIVRLGTLFGLGGRTQNSMFNRLLGQFYKGDEIRLISDEYRSFTWVKDLAPALEKIIAHSTERVRTFHLALSEKETYFSFAENMAKAFDFEVPLVPVPGDAFVSDRATTASNRGKDLSLDSSLFCREFGFKFTDVKTALSCIATELNRGVQ